MLETVLFEDAKKLDWSDTDSFMLSYDYFLDYFRQKDSLDLSDFVIGAHFTYGWMPTILDFKGKNNDWEWCVKSLNKVHNKQSITNRELQTLADVVNGSVVGVSKLLHFIDPNQYAIWDSNVCEYLNNRTVKRWKTTDIESYRNYIELLQTLTNNSVTGAIRGIIGNRFKADASDLRILEVVMFLTGRRLQAEKRASKKDH